MSARLRVEIAFVLLMLALLIGAVENGREAMRREEAAIRRAQEAETRERAALTQVLLEMERAICEKEKRNGK